MGFDRPDGAGLRIVCVQAKTPLLFFFFWGGGRRGVSTTPQATKLGHGMGFDRPEGAGLNIVCFQAKAPLPPPIIFISVHDSIGPPCYVSCG